MTNEHGDQGLPYVIAVSGHRDLDARQRASLGRRFSALLELVLVALPHTPVVVLSALADGADRAFAATLLDLRERLERDGAHDSARRLSVAVPMPLPRAEYLATFGLPASPSEPLAQAHARSVEEFEALQSRLISVLGSSAQAYRLEAPALDDETQARVSRQQTQMRAAGASEAEIDAVGAYTALARYLLQHAHLVVVAWDGNDQQRLCGGTSDLVATRLAGFARVHNQRSARRFYEPDRGPVVHLPVVRGLWRGPDSPEPEGGAMRVHLPGGAGDDRSASMRWPVSRPTLEQWFAQPVASLARWLETRALRHLLRRIPPSAQAQFAEQSVEQAALLVWTGGISLDRVNGEHRRLLRREGDRYRARLVASARQFRSALPPSTADGDAGIALLSHRFAVVDVLAIRFRWLWRLRWQAITMGAVVASLASVAKVVLPMAPLLAEAGAFMAGALLAIAVYFWVTVSPLRNAYLDCRAIAEGLRFQAYWFAAGLPTLVTDHYVLKWREELGWLRSALDAACAVPTVTARSPLDVGRKWVGDQLQYLHGPTITRRRIGNERVQEWGGRLLLLGLALGAMSLALGTARRGGAAEWLGALMKAAPAVGAAMLAYNSRLATSETLNQASHMAHVYSRAMVELEAIDRGDVSDRDSAARSLLEALGKEALAENASWLTAHRQRRVSWHGK